MRLGHFNNPTLLPIEDKGTDWLDLASDQKTMFYTSEGGRIMRLDVSGTGTQLGDFADIGGTSFALRLLPPGDGSGGLLVANSSDIKRLDGAGNIVQTYDAPGEDSWFALNLDPNGKSFWAGDFSTGDFFRFNIATGAIEVGPINTGTGSGTLFGLCVKGEPAAALLSNSAVNNLKTDATSTQSETSVAVSSVNSPGTTVMVGFNDIYNSEVTGYAVSYDGGTKWNDKGALPHPSTWSNGGDPVLTVDKKGVFYFAQLAHIKESSGKQDQIVSLSKCTDSTTTGIKCGMPMQVSDTVPDNCILFFCDKDKSGNDKPGIVYDPVNNRVYVTWTHFGSTTIIKLRSYNVSTGKLDSKTYNLYTAAASSMNGSDPVVTSDGVVHVFFETGLNTENSRFINYVKFKNGTISDLFSLSPIYPAGSLTSGCGRDALHTQAFNTVHAARTNEFPTAAVDKSGNIDIVWNANLPSGFGPSVSVIWVATLINKTDTANFQVLSVSDKFDSTGTLLIQWQPTVAVTGATNSLIVTYFQVIQLADGTYRIERDMVSAPASAKPTFSSPSPISTQSWQPDKTNPNFNAGVANCYMGDYDGSASTTSSDVVWVYWGDNRDVTNSIGPQPDIWGLTAS